MSAKTVDQETLASLQNRLKDRYPSKQVRHSWSGQFEFKGDAPPVAKGSSEPFGYLFTSADGKQVVQARRHGFSFTRLTPYQNWEAFIGEARDLWQKYVQLTRPEKVTRVALRFINRLDLPLPITDLKQYLLTGPELAPGLPQGLTSFFFRVVVPDTARQAVAIITETTEDAEHPRGRLPVILDIDAFREGVFSTSGDKLWPIFEQLRLFKNHIFFESLTEEAKELFK